MMNKTNSKFVSLRACLISYDSCTRDVNNHLKFITSQLEKRVQTQNKYSKFQERLNTYLQQTKVSIKKGKKLAGIKFAMLIHYLFLNYTPLLRDKHQNKNNVKIFYFLSELLTSLQENLKSCRPNPLEKDKVFLSENVIMPYVFYLQKKFQYIEIKLMQLHESGQMVELNKQNQPDYSENRLALLKEQCYKYLNLLNKGLVLSNKLITLLTYYLRDNQYLQHFNILLATDFAPIYTNMVERFNQIKQIQKHFSIQSSQFREIEKEIENSHEGMYIVYLNRYMNHMRSLAPKFIDFSTPKSKLEKFYDQKNFEALEKKKKSQINKSLNANTSIGQHDSEDDRDDAAAYQRLTKNLSLSQVISIVNPQDAQDPPQLLRGSFKKKASEKYSSSSGSREDIQISNEQVKGAIKKYENMNTSINLDNLVKEEDGKVKQYFDKVYQNLSASQTLIKSESFQQSQDLRSSFKKKTSEKQANQNQSQSGKFSLVSQ